MGNFFMLCILRVVWVIEDFDTKKGTHIERIDLGTLFTLSNMCSLFDEKISSSLRAA